MENKLIIKNICGLSQMAIAVKSVEGYYASKVSPFTEVSSRTGYARLICRDNDTMLNLTNKIDEGSHTVVQMDESVPAIVCIRYPEGYPQSQSAIKGVLFNTLAMTKERNACIKQALKDICPKCPGDSFLLMCRSSQPEFAVIRSDSILSMEQVSAFR